MPPTYRIADFYAACASRFVFVKDKAKIGARTEFNLKTTSAILHFIVGGGLEKLTFIDTKPIRKWPPPPAIAPMVDSYNFSSGPRHGYLAFFKPAKQRDWILKSFKRDIFKIAPINLPFSSLGALRDRLAEVENNPELKEQNNK